MRPRHRSPLYLTGLGIFGLLIWHYDGKDILEKMGTMSWQWVLLAGICILSIGFIGAINVFLFVARDHKVTLTDFLPLYWASWAVGLVVPGQVGDLASIGFLLRRHSLAVSTVLGRAVLDKAISLIVMFGFVIVGLAVSVQGLSIKLAWLLELATFLLFGGVVFYFLLRGRWQYVFKAGNPGLGGALARAGMEFIQTMRQTPVRVLLNVALTIVKVTITGIAYWAMFHALGNTDLAVLRVVILATTAGLVAYLPISINGIGTVEAVGIFLFGQVGISAMTVISAYIGLRILVLGAAWVPTLGWWAHGVRKADSLT
jgi:uncharacterized membrane protein YbhN (UPF0104 family)